MCGNNLSKCFSLYGGPELPAGADMHTYITTGNYACSTTANASKLVNCPMTKAFYLKITTTADRDGKFYIIQEYVSYDGRTKINVGYDPYNNVWGKPTEFATKDDLGVTEFNGGKPIEIDGTLSGIGKWINSQGFTGTWRSVRCNTNNKGYFGNSAFCILWNCSSANYGWCILMSDNSKMVAFGQNSDGWHWYAPSLTEVS